MKKKMTYLIVVNKTNLFKLENMLLSNNIAYDYFPTPKEILSVCTKSIRIKPSFAEEVSNLLYLYTDVLVEKIITL
ncbi:putative Se/S carrier-like protein [Helicovermis profundi]|uniref:Putative Se/S carrier protein-like domain-containing protein n=1 Tax=Helicovermis profundi TaxID=3065157 RepID=A0AAU9E6S1_9FIRM|nr:hypothetical protein HLPR_14290 [Clostridia bacterium S502]